LARQRQYEDLLLSLPDAARIREHARVLTAAPHVAGTPGNDAVARYIADRFRDAGLRVELASYPVYLGFVKRASLEQVAPVRRVLATPETPRAPEEAAAGAADRTGWSAYSPSADVTAEVVFAHHAREEDFAALDALGVQVRGRIVLARNFRGYRGGKALLAERRGAAGIVFYSDPADDGAARGAAYPEGPWGPEDHLQRGSIAYDFNVPGDPLTPGWPSLPGARRIRPEAAASLPRIPAIPISGLDARVILESLGGPEAPPAWKGGLPIAYRLGPGPSRVRLAIEASFETRPITNVVGYLPGRDEPERRVILGNHHDAWVFGAVDPVSGTAAMLELARVAGEMARRGLRPRRTLVFGSWDAEEWTLTGSTEWGEDRRQELERHGVACLNIDTAVSGPAFKASSVPTLRRFIAEALRDVPDPASGKDLLSVTAAAGRDEGLTALYTGRVGDDVPGMAILPLGSGSDYTVFFNHLGIPSLDAEFGGPMGVYHSIFDSHGWMERFGDPGFRYHAAMTRVWGFMAYRMANADLLPFEESPYPADVAGYLSDLEKEAAGGAVLPDLAGVRGALAEWRKEAAAFDAAAARVLTSGPPPSPGALAAANGALMQAERDLLHAKGIPGRPWFRHLIYAPLPTYSPEFLPGLRASLAGGDARTARAQAAILANALRARAATLGRATAALSGDRTGP
ncbi:MAG: M28 family metallopeptidase, partial [Candidatus Polarisedimenticolia bacterium]